MYPNYCLVRLTGVILYFILKNRKCLKEDSEESILLQHWMLRLQEVC